MAWTSNPKHDRAGALVRRNGSRRKGYRGQAGPGSRKPNSGRSWMAVPPARPKGIVGEDVTADVRASETAAFTKRAWSDRCRHSGRESRANSAGKQRESRAIGSTSKKQQRFLKTERTWRNGGARRDAAIKSKSLLGYSMGGPGAGTNATVAGASRLREQAEGQQTEFLAARAVVKDAARLTEQRVASSLASQKAEPRIHRDGGAAWSAGTCTDACVWEAQGQVHSIECLQLPRARHRSPAEVLHKALQRERETHTRAHTRGT